MAEITAALVKDLREKTGAGMMDCKKALNDTGGNVEEAIDYLRKKGLSSLKKSRVAAEGLIGVKEGEGIAALVEVNSETDFVARNPLFQDFVRNVAHIAMQSGGVDLPSLGRKNYDDQHTVEKELERLISVIGENMTIRRLHTLSVSKGVVCSYVHSSPSPHVGRIGVLVAIESDGDRDVLRDLGKKIAMHVAAANPQALSIDAVNCENLERERQIYLAQACDGKKSQDVIQKMVEGRIRKYYEEIVLLEQVFVMDGKMKVAQIVAQKEEELKTPVKVASFVCFRLGEGIEKQESDFAAEVQQLADSH